MEVAVIQAGLAVALCFLLLSWSYRVLNWLWLEPKRLERCLKKQGLQGKPYRVLYGDMKENFKMLGEATSKPLNLSDDIVPRLLPYFDQCLKTYGPKPRVTIMEPELIKEILTRMTDFRKPALNPLFKLLALGLANYEDQKWVNHRKLINPAFHFEKLKNMMPALHLSSTQMVSKWEKLVSAEGSAELDIWQDLQKLASDVISRTAFGSSFEDGKKIFELQKELASLLMETARQVYIPGWRFLPTKMNRRMKAVDKEIQALLRGIIDKKEKVMKEEKSASDDLLGILIESNMREIKEHNNDKNVGMTIHDVIEECKLFYIAGQETTSVLLVWTMIMLSQHQDWQERAREEVFQVFGNEKPNMGGLNHLKIVCLALLIFQYYAFMHLNLICKLLLVNMILHEVLRLYPPGILLARATRSETKLGSLMLPAGVIVSIPVISVHRDPELWGKDANQLKPERFSEGVFKATNGQFQFLPFGGGPRICLGQSFALLEAKLAIVLILQRFSFELSPAYIHAPYSIITLQPQHGAHLILHKL